MKQNEAGVTLTELLIATTLTVLLMTAVFGILDSSIKGYNIQTDQAEAQTAAQTAFMRVERELRQAEKPLLWVSSTPGTYDIIAFKADLNDDGTSEAVMYEYIHSFKSLRRRVNTTGDYDFSASIVEPVADNVVNGEGQPVFAYYGSDLATPLDPNSGTSNVINNARIIRLRLLIDKDSQKPPAAIDLVTDIKLRNFQY